MARNPYAGTCQQRCVYASALAEAAHNEPHASVLQVALLEGVVYHLHSAYVQHLREIAENYSCADGWTIDSIQDLVAVCSAQAVTAPEVAEMFILLEDGASWLTQCLEASSAFQRGGQVQPAKVSHAGVDLHQDNEYSVALDTQTVSVWVGAAIELTERHRALMHEY